MKASILSNRPPAGVSISGRSSRERARTRSAPKASSSTSSSFESDHLAPKLSRRHAAALLLASGASASLSLLLLGPGPAEAADAAAAPAAAPTLSSGKRGIAAYVRKRKLDPLPSYVPAVLAAREQLAGLEGLVASDPVEARIELRSGAFEGLRDNVRAVGEYATAAAESSRNGGGSSSSSEDNGSVKSFFASVQKLDYELFAAAREKRDPSGAAVEALRAGVAALDALLATVPAADLDEARRLVAKTAAAQVEREKTTAKKEGSSSSSSATTTTAAAAAVSGDDGEKLRMLVPGAAR